MKSNFLIKRVLVAIGVMQALAFSSLTLTAQSASSEPGPYLLFYQINGEKPQGFEDFDSFKLDAPAGQDPDNLPTDPNGDVHLGGYITTINKERFTFQKALLMKGGSEGYKGLKFSTRKRRGIHFVFSGHFLEKPVQEKKGGDYTKLRGILTKYQNGRRVANAELGFYVFAIL